MRISLSLGWCGYLLDFTLAPAGDLEESAEESAFEPYQDAGSITSTPVGFSTASVPWEDPGSLHQFDPDYAGEDT